MVEFYKNTKILNLFFVGLILEFMLPYIENWIASSPVVGFPFILGIVLGLVMLFSFMIVATVFDYARKLKVI